MRKLLSLCLFLFVSLLTHAENVSFIVTPVWDDMAIQNDWLNKPEWATGSERSIAVKDGKIYMVSRDYGMALLVFDSSTGELEKKLPITGATEGGTFAVNYILFDAAGRMLIANGAGSSLTIYQADVQEDEVSLSVWVTLPNPTELLPEGYTLGRYDGFALYGEITGSGYIVTPGAGGNAQWLYNFDAGIVDIENSILLPMANNGASAIAVAVDENRFIITSRNAQPRLYNRTIEDWSNGIILSNSKALAGNNAYNDSGLAYFHCNGREYVAHAADQWGKVEIFDITDGFADGPLVYEYRYYEYTDENTVTGNTGSATNFSSPIIVETLSSNKVRILHNAHLMGMFALNFEDNTTGTFDPVFRYEQQEVVVGTDAEPFTNPLISIATGTITYESSSEEIATIDETGKVTITGLGGDAIITATVSADGIYNAATASYTVMVSGQPRLSYEETEINKVMTDGPFINPLSISSKIFIPIYESSDPSVAIVDQTGEVTIVGIGTTTITATVEATEDYEEVSTSYTLDVSLDIPTLKFVLSEVSKLIVDPAFTNELTTNSDGLITYESSNVNVATVDQAGEVTIVGAGTTTITASVEETEIYRAANISYVLTVSQPVTVGVANGTVIYWAAKGGNINYAELNSADRDIINTGIPAGGHPFNLLINEDLLYVVDAGVQVGWITSSAGFGDGEVFVVSYDETSETYIRESMINNYSGDAYEDFHYGYIDAEEEMLYLVDRFQGIRKLPLTVRDEKLNTSENLYWVHNGNIGYNGNGIGYGATNGPVLKINDIWYWAKNSTGQGIFRFVESDIDQTSIPQAGILQPTYKVRGAVYDEVSEILYVSHQGASHICAIDINSGNLIAVLDQSPKDTEGGENEAYYVTGMAIDKKGGYLYWAYRAPEPELEEGETLEEYYEKNPLAKSGIKRFKLSDLDSGYLDSKVEYFLEGVEAYGVAIGNLSGPESPLFMYAVSSITKNLSDEAFINPLTFESDGTVTYSSSNENVATVDQTGLVTLINGGTTVITASVAATENFGAASASYTLTVETGDGINQFNYSEVNILSTAEGVQITFNGEAQIEVYTVNGVLIENIIVYEKHNVVLEKGVYVVKVNGKSYKVIK